MPRGRTTAGEDSWPELRRCNGGGGCVQVDNIAGCFVLRDTKNPMQPGLVFSRAEYMAFRNRLRGDSRARSTQQYAASMLRSLALILQDILR